MCADITTKYEALRKEHEKKLTQFKEYINGELAAMNKEEEDDN